MKRMTSVFLSALMLLSAQPVSAAEPEADSFFEDFSAETLDRSQWLIAEKNWGGTVTENGVTADYNGGVIAENVSVRDGNLLHIVSARCHFLRGCGSVFPCGEFLHQIRTCLVGIQSDMASVKVILISIFRFLYDCSICLVRPLHT